MSRHTRSSKESVVELHDYHVRALLTAFELRDHPTVTGLVRKLGSSASLDDGRPVGRALA